MELARRAFVDTVGCAVAGSVEAPALAVRDAVAGWGSGACAIYGSALRVPAPAAALANGTAAHAQDYDDVNNPAMSHPSAVLVPALLALATEIEADGRRCLDAYLVGYEILTRLGEAANLAHYFRGWHTTLSLGAPAAAAACARLLRLDAARTRAALSMATSMGGGSKRQFGTGTKPLHAGLAAQAGILAARLAASGLDAAPEIFEGRWGMLEMTAGDGAPGFAGVLERLGNPPAAREHGVWFKLYPCCASTHRPIDAALALRAQHALDTRAIASVEGMVSANAAANLRYATPADPSQARFSLPYCVAAALLDGAVTPASFTPQAIARPEAAALMSRIRMTVDPDLDGERAVADLVERATLTVRTDDGRVLSQCIETPRGHPLSPLDDDLLDSKFRACTQAVLAPQSGEHALAALRGMGVPGADPQFTRWLQA
jgi:2-methylcitrate dehydratase PrpD